MAVSVTQEPISSSLTFGDQPLIYTMTSNTGGWNDAYRFVVTVKESTALTQIAKFYISRNPNNVAHFDLGQITKSRVEVDTNQYGYNAFLQESIDQWFMKSETNVEKYTVEFAEYNGVSEGSTDVTKTIFLCDGKKAALDGYEYRTSMADFYGTAISKKYWMTDREPVDNKITVYCNNNTMGVMAFINRSSVSDVTKFEFTLVGSASPQPLVTETIDISAGNGSQAPAATTQAGFVSYLVGAPWNIETTNQYLSDNPTWAYYEFKPLDASNNQRGNILRFEKQCVSYKNPQCQVFWANTVGGWDSLEFNGLRKTTVSKQQKTYRKNLGSYGAAVYSYEDYDPEVIPFQNESQYSYVCTGIFNKTELDLLQYCFRSKKVYIRELKKGSTTIYRYIPIIVSTNGFQVITDPASKIYTATLQFTSSQTIR